MSVGKDGWTIGLNFHEKISTHAKLTCGNVAVSAWSEQRTMVTLKPNPNSDLQDLTNGPGKVYLWCKFENIDEIEMEAVQQMTLYYIKTPIDDASCLVDRFMKED